MIPALFYEMFGDPINNINSYDEVPFGTAITISNKKLDPQNHPVSDFCYLGLENIESGTGKIVGTTQHQGAQIKSLKNVFENGDILYGKLRPYLNKVHLSTNSGICSTDILVLKPNRANFSAGYLCAAMQSTYFLNKASSHMQGANLPRISVESLLQIHILQPSLEIQRVFTAKAQESLVLIAHQELSLQKLNALFDSMLNQVFSSKE
jgi:type I restriction enzyme S subunit